MFARALRGHAAEKPVVNAPSIQYLGQWGVKGDGPGQFKDPSGIATNSLGDIFIVDSGSAFISKFAPSGKPLLSFQEDGLNHPQSIAIDQRRSNLRNRSRSQQRLHLSCPMVIAISNCDCAQGRQQQTC